MSVARLISQIFSGIWLIEPGKAQGYYPLIDSVLKGDFKNNEFGNDGGKIKDQPYFIAVENSSTLKVSSSWDMNSFSEEDIPEGSMVVVPINGAISKYNYCGTAGTNTIANFLKKVDGMKNVSSVLLVVDSPGGEVYGTRNLAEVIMGMSKPVVAFVDGIAASGAYWIISAADKIISNNDTDEVGSIGTFCSFADIRGWKQYEGVKFHEVYASKSINKNKAYRDAINGNGEDKYDALKQQIDVINESFITGVKQGRGDKISTDEVFTGKLYFTKEALGIGLIDEIGNFEHAVQVTRSMISNSNSFLNTGTMKFKIGTAIKNLLGFKTEEEVAITQEQLDTINTTIESQDVKISELEAQIQTASETSAARISELEASVAERDATIANLNTKLSERPGAPAPAVKTEKTDQIDGGYNAGWDEASKKSAEEAGFLI